MGLDTVLILAMTVFAIVCFVWVEINSRRNLRAEKQAKEKAAPEPASGAAKSEPERLA
jgi:hypothetical protein